MGADIVLISPSSKDSHFSFHLEYDSINNVVEYEALLHGIELAKACGIELLKIIEDFDLIMMQVKERFPVD